MTKDLDRNCPRPGKTNLNDKRTKNCELQLAHSLLHLFFYSLVCTHDRLLIDDNFCGIGSWSTDS